MVGMSIIFLELYVPGGHQHQGQAVDELHPSQRVHPHVHQHAIQNWHGDQPGIII